LEFLLLAEKKIKLIDAVNRAIAWDLRARNTSECGVHVDDVNDLVRYTTGRNFSRPANDEGGAERGLHRREVSSAPRTSVTLPWIGTFGTVIAGEDDDGLVINTGLVDGVEDLSGPVVHLGEGVGPVAVAGIADEVRMRKDGHVDHGGRYVGVEGLVCGGVALDEVDGAVGDLGFHGAPGFEVEFAYLFGGLAFVGVEDRPEGSDFRIPTLFVTERGPETVGLILVRPEGFVVSAAFELRLASATLFSEQSLLQPVHHFAGADGGNMLRKVILKTRTWPEVRSWTPNCCW
jgi:hypothetical protein